MPGRGKVFATLSLVDENGFSYEYLESEVPAEFAREFLTRLHLHETADNENPAFP